jgi:low affinity Fe/Cu permease
MIWILSWLPNFIFHFIVIASVLGLLAATFFNFIPFVSKYTLPIKIGCIVMLVISIWFEGAISNNDAWLEKVHALEKKVAEAEAKSAEANSKLISQIAAKNKEIAEVQTKLKLKIKEAAAVMDSECKVSTYAIEIINEAAIGPKGGKK